MNDSENDTKKDTDEEEDGVNTIISQDEQVKDTSEDSEMTVVAPGDTDIQSSEESETKVALLLADFEVGAVIEDKYKVINVLGKGGMGTVYKVEHLMFSQQKFFALKVLHPQFSQNENFRMRFQREIEIAMEFAHQNAVQIREFGVTKDGLQYFSMDYSSGVPLRDILNEEEIIEEKRALKIGRQVLSALQNAHSKGIAHRDLKPENILIEQRQEADHALVLDFGIAKLLTDGEQPELTQNNIVGTPIYMSPEQAGLEEIDVRTDIYTLGVILYEMVTGKLPFSGTTREILTAHMLKAPTPLRKVNVEVSQICEDTISKAMAKEKEYRYANATVMIEAIDRVLSGSAEVKKRDNSKLLYAATVVLFLLVAIGVGYQFSNGNNSTLSDEIKKTQEKPSFTLHIEKPEAFIAGKTVEVEFDQSEVEVVGSIKSAPGGLKILLNDNPVTLDGEKFTVMVPLSYGNNNLTLSLITPEEMTRYNYNVIRKAPQALQKGEVAYSDFQRTKNYPGNVPTPKGVKWKLNSRYQTHSHPLFSNGVIYFGSMVIVARGAPVGKVSAVDATSGKILWAHRMPKPILSAPLVVGGMVFHGSYDSYFYAFSIKDGKEVWKFNAGGKVFGSAVAVRGTVYFGSENMHFYALDMATGKVHWKFKALDRLTTSSAFADGIIYFGDKNANFYALDVKTGKTKWQISARGHFCGTPCVSKKFVHILSGSYIQAVDKKTGDEKWAFRMKSNLFAPAVGIKNMYISNHRAFCAVDIKTGKKVWEFTPKWTVTSSPSYADGKVYLGADRRIYIFDPTTGKVKHELDLKGRITGTMSIINDTIYSVLRDDIVAIR